MSTNRATYDASESTFYRIPADYHLHVLDQTTNMTRVVIGEGNYFRKENEHVISIVVPSNAALRLLALQDFEDDKIKKIAGDQWLFEGPGTFVPRKEVYVVDNVSSFIIKPNHGLKLRARAEIKDRDGNGRVTGEEWIVKKIGAYLPGAYEEIVGAVDAYILTEKEAVHVQAKKTFTDEFGNLRKNGHEWLVTLEDTETYIPGVYESVLGLVSITALNNRQYCVILNPVDDKGSPQLGRKKMVKGETSFFLFPGECLESGIQDIYVLSENEGLILRATETFEDNRETPAVTRKPGERWMIRGPTEYIPPIEVEIIAKRYAIALDENEGIYVKNIKNGQVRLVSGSTYMLTQDEELWVKDLPEQVQKLLNLDLDSLSEDAWRNRAAAVPGPKIPKSDEGAKAVTLQVPHNAAVQVYDYREKKSRVIFGPDLVMLAPNEHFTTLSISGDKPKRPNVIKTLFLFLGPEFCTDIITVETANHTLLSLQLSYNWYFDIGDKSAEAAAKLFSVPDFIGDLCKVVASRIRHMVASTNFDDFHKNSGKIIRTAVFGVDENQKVRKTFHFPQNNLYITSLDIQDMDPVHQRSWDYVDNSVRLANKSEEAIARHEAERKEQEARSRLKCQRISDEVEAERIEQEARSGLKRRRIADEVETELSRKKLLELQVTNMSMENYRESRAEALNRREIQKIESEAKLERLQKAREAKLIHVKRQIELEIEKCKQLADIEVEKVKTLTETIGGERISLSY